MKHLEVFIFGEQGAGKTSAARKLVNDYTNAHNSAHVVTVSEEDFNEYEGGLLFGELLNRIGGDVYIFDGLILEGEDLDKAMAGIKRAAHLRKGDKPILAIYVVQGKSEDFITYRYDK